MLKDESKANSLKPNRLNVYLFTNNQQEEEKNAVALRHWPLRANSFFLLLHLFFRFESLLNDQRFFFLFEKIFRILAWLTDLSCYWLCSHAANMTQHKKRLKCLFFLSLYQRQIIYTEKRKTAKKSAFFSHTYTNHWKQKIYVYTYRHSNTKQQIYSHID